MGLAVRIVPTLLYRGDQMVKGERFQSWRSVGHIEQGVRVMASRGVDEMILLDIAATPEGRGPDIERVRQLTSYAFTPITVGGGVRKVQDIDDLLRVGADKVAICSEAWSDRGESLLRKASNRFGSQAIVVALDVKQRRVTTCCGEWPLDTLPTLAGIARQAEGAEYCGAGEILLTAIDREGTMQGYDLDLIRAVSQAVDIPVIAHGGCSGYEDMVQAVRAGASAVAAGALFQFTDATPAEAARYLQAHGLEARVEA